MQPGDRPDGAGARHGRLGRFAVLDAQPVNRDGFTRPDPALGLVAFDGPNDPEPAVEIRDGRVVHMDGVDEQGFDVIDELIARHGIDPHVAPKAMAMTDVDLARALCDYTTPRDDVARLVDGLTPAKLARVVALLRPTELQQAVSKMRVRRTPSIQAHVTNQLDDPLLLAADAAEAVAYGFRELETTVPVLGHAPSNALAVFVGSQVGVPGALIQCSIEEALELRLGVRGLTTYAETVSIYGTEPVFVDGDDTPYSKTFLTAAYASRGLKMRVTSGAGAEVLMGAAEGKSMAYLESRCVSLARAMGTQGVQNGGIDGVGVVSSVPDGMRELLAENLMVMARDMESCSGNDTIISESSIRRASHTLPILLAGSDYIFSGYGSIPRYDNTFAISNFNAEDLDDYLVMQRDWGVDGGLTPQREEHIEAARRRGAQAAQAVYRHLGLADFDDARVDAAIYANDSRDLPPGDPLAVTEAVAAIEARDLTVLDVVAALAHTGFSDEADHVLAMTRRRLTGAHLQTAAVFDGDLNVLSKVTDPNDYAGPGTGYRPSPERQAAIDGIRQARTTADLVADQRSDAGVLEVVERGPATQGSDPREVCIGVSPAFARTIWRTLSGLTVGEVLRQLEAGLEEEHCRARVIRVEDSIDLGRIGLTAARLAGSGIGIGLQGKGTTLIHRRDLAPLANLELFSIAPMITPQMYRKLAQNAARHARGATPVPVFKPGTDEAYTARYHTTAIALVALERSATKPGHGPTDLEVSP